MADTKVSALSALTGANLASGDLIAVVDVSDATMAASGTDKKMTAAELTIGLLAPTELDYTELTSNVNPTATAEASADTVVTAGAVTFDGSTRVEIEFFVPLARPQNTAAALLSFYLFDGSSSIGRIAVVGTAAANTTYVPVKVSRFLTPSSGSHTYSIRATVSTGTGNITAGAGGSGNTMPGYIRITQSPT